jgi:hypothetical protein
MESSGSLLFLVFLSFIDPVANSLIWIAKPR